MGNMKVVKRFAVLIIAIFLAMTIAGCANNSDMQKSINDMQKSINDLEKSNSDLKKSIGDLEKANSDLKKELDKLQKNGPNPSTLNVFWTDKYEYAEYETITVYFRDIALYSIKKHFHNFVTGGGGAAWISVIITCLYFPSMTVSSVLDNICLRWDEGVCYNSDTYSASEICYKNIGKEAGTEFNQFNAVYAAATFFDLIICVPGTYFPLAVIKNITIEKTS